jgi:hypothetical protein
LGLYGSLGIEGGVTGLGFIMFGMFGVKKAIPTIKASKKAVDEIPFVFNLPPNSNEIIVINKAIISQISTILPNIEANELGTISKVSTRAIMYCTIITPNVLITKG